MKCFKCNRIFTNIKEITIHFLYFHNLKPYDTFICVYEQCPQSFTSIHALKKHVKSKHNSNQNTSDTSIKLTHTTSFEKNDAIEIEAKETEILPEQITSFCIQDNILNFVLSLYSKDNLSRKQANEILNDIQEFLTKPISLLLESIENFKTDATLQKIAKILLCPFENFNTEYKLLKHLESKDLYLSPNNYKIDETVQEKHQKGKISIKSVATKGIMMPVEFQIKKFLEQPGIFKKILDYEKEINSSNSNSHFLNSKLWQNKLKNFKDKIVLPLYLYYDDFEIDNPLGSHAGAHTISAFYYTFASLPPHYLSKLDNIFIAMLHLSKDKHYGLNNCISGLIQILNNLEKNGLRIETEYGSTKVYFCLGLILGDNLGLNTILNFSNSFSANYYCRFCKIQKSEAQLEISENKNLLRNPLNYANDIEMKDFKSTGIKDYSIFNEIKSFHVTQNFCVDIMHDLFEGICRYDLAKIICYYIDNNTFTIMELNRRKQNFNYGELEIGNFSVPLSVENLRKNNFHMSASEMVTFVTHFPLIVGDLISPQDKVWKFFLKLLNIVDIVLKSSITENDLKRLKSVVSEHNKLYIELFNETLKPKYHIMLHYPLIIEQCGPLKQFWCFRYESKHRQLKNYLKNISSRVNVCMSVAIKMQLKFAYNLLQNQGLNVETIVMTYLKSNFNTDKYCNDILKLITESRIALSISLRGQIYKQGFFLPLGSIDDLKLYKIEAFLIRPEILIICKEVFIKKYNKHFAAYSVGNLKENFEILSIKTVTYPPVTLHKIKNDTYFRIKYF